jgi:endonuclease YncB( thermonuclease family)
MIKYLSNCIQKICYNNNYNDKCYNQNSDIININDAINAVDDDTEKTINKNSSNNYDKINNKEKYLEHMKEKLYAVKNEKNIPYFSFEGKKYYARPCNIYDGDTFSIIFEIESGEIIKYRCRCLGYDTPEMKPSLSNPNREKEKSLALIAKKRFTDLLNANSLGLILVECHGFDKYGRILVTIYNNVDEMSVNELMIIEGHGKPYDGGKKDVNW